MNVQENPTDINDLTTSVQRIAEQKDNIIGSSSLAASHKYLVTTE